MRKRRKVSGELIALSSAAVLGVYVAGYVLTEPAADLLNHAGRVSVPARAGAYRDGSYTAIGTSRFGTVAVVVSIQNGRIAAVWITAVTTRYPADLIAGLPGQVVARQSAAVDIVTRATGSTAAFIDAVQRALQQASG